MEVFIIHFRLGVARTLETCSQLMVGAPTVLAVRETTTSGHNFLAVLALLVYVYLLQHFLHLVCVYSMYDCIVKNK